MKRFYYIFGVIALMVLSSPTYATTSEHISSFESQIHLDRHNVVDITETIQYDFGTASRHGIMRDVPIEYNTADGSYYTTAAFKSAYQDGQIVRNQTTKSGNEVTFRLGDPDQTIAGRHTYILHYQLSPIVIQVGGRDRLLLDVTGNGWKVPIDKATATFSFDNPATLESAQCYAGSAGSTTKNCTTSAAPVTFAATNLQPEEGLTVNGYLPSGYVDHYLKPGSRPLSGKDPRTIIGLLAIALLGLAVGVILLLRYLRERRLKKAQTVIPQYEAPDNLKPAEIGLLTDNIADMREVTATLIDLAVRGHIKIEQTKAKSLFNKAKYKLYKLTIGSGLDDYEQRLLVAIFGNDTEKELDEVDRPTISNYVSGMHGHIKDRLKKLGYYGSIKSQRGLWQKLIGGEAITSAGAGEWAKVEGFKLYLIVAEKDRLNFSDAPEKTPERFNAFLPYAIALGVEKNWAKQFEGIDVSQNQDWYISGYGAWTALNLADDLGGGFANAASSSFAAPSSSSGGGSGGGFGGGGGGSW